MSKQKPMSDICRTCPTSVSNPPGFIRKINNLSNRINPVRERLRDRPMSDMSDKCPTSISKQRRTSRMTPAGDLEAIAKTVPCPDCGADPNMVCVDTDNAFWRCDIHLGRVAASQEVPF